MTVTLAEIAAKLGATVEGDGSIAITGVAGVRDGGPGEISFVSQARYAADAAASKVSALIVPRDWDKSVPAALLRVDKPDQVFIQVARLFVPPQPQYSPGIHPTAVIAPSAKIGADVHVGPHVVVESGAQIGARTKLLAGVQIGENVQIGDDCLFYPHVSVREHCSIGSRCTLHNGTVIGSDGFGYDTGRDGIHRKIPQIGIVTIGNDVEIGANTTVDRARFGKTKIGNGVKIDNLVQIAHNVVIGDHCIIVAQVAIAGSTILDHHVVVGGQAAISGHLTIGAGTMIGGQSGVIGNVPPGSRLWGTPARDHKEMLEVSALWSRLPEMRKKLAALEARLAAIEAKPG
jgi:UDP-3-O-[3-hydroxymyristoyl] glucosamine N-acyltransferase